MSSSLISLAVYGSGDVEEPKLSEFASQYTKHTNFAIESYSHKSDNGDAFGKKSIFRVPRIGDMITGATLEFDLPDIEINKTPSTPTTTTYNYLIWKPPYPSSTTFQSNTAASTPETLRGTNFGGGCDSNYDVKRFSKLYIKIADMNEDLYNFILNLLETQANNNYGRFQFTGTVAILAAAFLVVQSIKIINNEFIEISGTNTLQDWSFIPFPDVPLSDATGFRWQVDTEYTPQYGYVNNEGFSAINSVEFSIGDQIIQKLSGEYLYINSRTSVTDATSNLVERLTGTVSEFPLKDYNGLAASNIQDVQNLNEWNYQYDNSSSSNVYFPYGKAHDVAQLEKNGVYPRRYVIKLPFWFTQHISKSIPLCAINKQEMTIRVNFRDYYSLIYNVYGPIDMSDPRISNKKLENVSIKFEYAFLEQNEINFIKSREINMIISQLQMNEFDVPTIPNIPKSYEDMVFSDFRNNYSTLWESYHNKETFRLTFDNNVSRLYFLAQNVEYSQTPQDKHPTGWFGNQWFNYMPESTGYLFKSRTNNQRSLYNLNKESPHVEYRVVSNIAGAVPPVDVANNYPTTYVAGGVESIIGPGEMTWLLPDTSNTACPFFSKFINPQIGARRRDQYMIFHKQDMNGNTNSEWWSNVGRQDFFQLWASNVYEGGNADPITASDPLKIINYDSSFDNVISIPDDRDYIYVAMNDVNYRNPDWKWDFDSNGKSANCVGSSSNVVEVSTGKHLDSGKFLRNTTNWPYFNQVRNLEMTFNGEVVLPKDVADTLFLTAVESLNHDNTMPYELININSARLGPFQFNGALIGGVDLQSNVLFQNTEQFLVPFVENIYKYDFGITNNFSNKYPTGQINASRIKDLEIKADLMPSVSDRKFRVYAESYNILQVKNGIAGVLFTCGNLVK